MTAAAERIETGNDVQQCAVYLVNTATHDHQTSRLSEVGIRQAEAARQQILQLGLGQDAVILTSAADTDLSPAATAVAETAKILYANGFLGSLVESDVLTKVARNPRAVKSLSRVIDFALEREGLQHASGVIVVTQQPLINPVLGRGGMVRPGQVVRFDPSAWPDSPDFFELQEAIDVLGGDAPKLYPERSSGIDLASTISRVSEVGPHNMLHHPASVWPSTLHN